MININKIQKTASTLFDLEEHSDFAYCKEISDELKKEIALDKISTDHFSAFIVSRFATNQYLLDFMVQKFGENLQIIELGSGFTPHYLNLKGKVLKYIEVDFEENSSLKKIIIQKIFGKTESLKFIGGDILDEETWSLIGNEIDLSKPVFIFSEGVISQYFNVEQKQKIANFVKPLLKIEGSCFVLDDTLRNHPEFFDNQIIKEGMLKITEKSGSDIYREASSNNIEDVNYFWKQVLNTSVFNFDYFLSKPEMDFVISNFKLVVNIVDNTGVIIKQLKDLSESIFGKRIWK